MQFYASCPRGLESLLMDELANLGATNLKEHPTHIVFEGDLELAYKACLHSRLANRIYLCLLDGQFSTVEEMYDQVNSIEWGWHFDLDQTFAVSCVTRKNHLIKHSGFGALKVKDAIVDFYQERYEQRPSVDKDHPDYRIHAIINGSQIKIGIDLAGRSLNQRGYRDSKGRAPIKENLAAAMLLRAKWPELAKQGYAFHDPMCGTGTLLIEAAMMACDMAPGSLNPNFDFRNWKQHDDELWQTLLATAKRQANKNLQQLDLSIIGSDSHHKSLELAQENIKTAGFSDLIKVFEQDVRSPIELGLSQAGLVVTNPPYGERIGNQEVLDPVYRQFGDYLKSSCEGWQAAMITTEQSFAKALGIRSHKQYKLKNGDLDCQLYLFDVKAENFYSPFDPKKVNQNWDKGLSDGAVMLKNRLKKNLARFKSYLKQNDVTCYRLYDADLPEFSAAIDVYDDELYIQEYAAPKDIPAKVAEKRLYEIRRVASGVMQIPEARIYFKQRQNPKESEQSSKQTSGEDYKIVQEQGFKFQVNLSRYADIGLALDHRKIRRMIMSQAKGKKFLNLFACSAAVSAYAAQGGAKTTTVNMSKAYNNWAIKNFALNNIAVYGHHFVQQDCLEWLQHEQDNQQFDLIFIDPPTFFNRNDDEGDAISDLQQDQQQLIEMTMNLLTDEGDLYFSNNFKKFELEQALVEQFDVKEITAKTLPIDFQKSRNHHRCWHIRHKTNS